MLNPAYRRSLDFSKCADNSINTKKFQKSSTMHLGWFVFIIFVLIVVVFVVVVCSLNRPIQSSSRDVRLFECFFE